MAAGPNHIVTTANVTIQVWNKAGTTKSVDKSFQSLFASVAPSTATFDPRVVYDSYAQRFVVLSLEQASPSTANIYLAVSTSSDPTSTWYVTKISALENVSGNNCWFDYPGLAVDGKAIYITGNLFLFGGSYQGSRLYIVPKGLGTGGFYDGGTATANRYDPYTASGGLAVSSNPALVYGATPGGAIGTWLAGYSRLTDGTNFYLQLIRVNSPTSSPTFTLSQISMGAIDSSAAFPGVPQNGTATTLDGGDPRDLSANWTAGSLWTTFDVMPPSGTNTGQLTAHYVQVNTAPSTPTITGQGDIGGEDISTGAYTFYPAIAANQWGDAVVGFSASNSSPIHLRRLCGQPSRHRFLRHNFGAAKTPC